MNDKCEIMGIKKTAIKLLEIDYTNFLLDGDTISGTPVVTENSSNQIIKVGAPTVVSASKVIILVTGVEVGQATITCIIDTVAGAREPTKQEVNVR